MNAPLPWIIADNGTDGTLVVGRSVAGWRGIDLAAMSVELRINGTKVACGEGRNVMGHPLSALTWLSNTLNRRGRHLRAGELVNTGTCTEIRFAALGDTILATFEGLGAVEVVFA